MQVRPLSSARAAEGSDRESDSPAGASSIPLSALPEVARPRAVGRNSIMYSSVETRNVAEYENRTPTSAGGQAVRNAWAAVVEWARARGLDVERQ